jgi:hypothetical protein
MPETNEFESIGRKNIESLFKINISLEPKKASSPDKTIEVFKI